MEPGTNGFDRRVAIVLLTVCVSLTLQEFIGSRATFHRWFGSGTGDPWWLLKGWGWWALWRVTGYVVLPAIALRFMGERFRDCYLSPRGFVSHLPLYGLLFALMIPVVLIASRAGTFQHTYPMYKLAHRSALDLALWWLLYIAQFASLEFFFRGFMLHGLRPSLGVNAIFVMVVPYCMIHYQKPMAEAFGAIGAGLVLGTLAMRTRSIWGGVAIHVAVAVTMDILALQYLR